jgi:hypothetical protein
MEQQEEFEDAQEPPQPPPQQHQQLVNLKIPPFWLSNPEACWAWWKASSSCATSPRITIFSTMSSVLFPSKLCAL